MVISFFKRRAGILAAAALVVLVLAIARSYRPSDTPFVPHLDGEVLEHVPAGAEQTELRRLERALAKRPDDLSTAVRVARMHMAAGRRSGDARQLSYAEAALSPWWTAPEPPLQALLLRATIKQTRHEFASSLVDLDALVARAPRDPQGWLTRATVLTVLGRYDEARKSCDPLAGLTTPLVVAVCRAGVDASTDQAAAARDAITVQLAGFRVDRDQASWARSVRGELSWYLGDLHGAEEDLRAALVADPDDVYTRTLLADLLLDTHREKDVLDLVPADEANEVLLLRRAIAAKRTHASDALELAAKLRATTNALRERGDTTHQREEARLLLDVEGNIAGALPVAVANWGVQHEPWDARVLLEAAVHDRKAAEPALAWMKDNHCVWPPLVADAQKVAP